ncbi:MAG: site-specific integrase, partial [Deltaproteobacteria bacterium]|nr:site-specific integrase [Deltaproteobacteria bacterium]
MPKLFKRCKTIYPGVYYIQSKTENAGKKEKIFYVFYRKNGKQIEEKAGRQFKDAMTAAKAARIRSDKIEGRKLSNRDDKADKAAAKKAEEGKWTIGKLWIQYQIVNPELKRLR